MQVGLVKEIPAYDTVQFYNLFHFEHYASYCNAFGIVKVSVKIPSKL